MSRSLLRLLGFVLVATPLFLAACDGGITGDENANVPPETELSVQAASLVDVLDERRLTSIVQVNWSGTDPDGFVEAFELRFYDESEAVAVGPETGWTQTTRRDSLILLPIPAGKPTANVVFEVRARDNEGALDPTPARTVFPVRNTPPTFRVSAAEAPPDTTWPAVSFAVTASDLDGEANLAAVEVALNDPDGEFISLPPDTDFLTLVAEDPSAQETTARLLLGRSGIPSEFSLPGFRTDADNTIYFRAVDAANFRSETAVYPDLDADPEATWYVKRVTSPILLVNDYRSSRHTLVMPYHREILDSYAGAGNYDEWYLAEPFQTGVSTIVLDYSDNLPSSPDPTLRETLRFWDHIYWVSTNVTNRAVGNNLPLVAGFLDPFFEQGGSLFVNVPIRLPSAAEDNLGNSALAILPLSGLFDFGAGGEFEDFTPFMYLDGGAAITPAETLPGGTALPALRAARFVEVLSFPIGTNATPLYAGALTAQRESGELVDWPGPPNLASFRDDGQVALLAVPLVNDFNGAPFLEGADGDPEAPREAVRLILDALGFPR